MTQTQSFHQQLRAISRTSAGKFFGNISKCLIDDNECLLNIKIAGNHTTTRHTNPHGTVFAGYTEIMITHVKMPKIIAELVNTKFNRQDCWIDTKYYYVSFKTTLYYNDSNVCLSAIEEILKIALCGQYLTSATSLEDLSQINLDSIDIEQMAKDATNMATNIGDAPLLRAVCNIKIPKSKKVASAILSGKLVVQSDRLGEFNYQHICFLENESQYTKFIESIAPYLKTRELYQTPKSAAIARAVVTLYSNDIKFDMVLRLLANDVATTEVYCEKAAK